MAVPHHFGQQFIERRTSRSTDYDALQVCVADIYWRTILTDNKNTNALWKTFQAVVNSAIEVCTTQHSIDQIPHPEYLGLCFCLKSSAGKS